MKKETSCQASLLRRPWVATALILFLLIAARTPCLAQQIVGTITGTVLDSSGAVVGEATVRAHNVATNLDVTAHSESNGTYCDLQSSGGNL